MFYLFHHMPKCGGTSFNAFLRSIFTVHSDYVGADHLKEPARFEAYKAKPLNLAGFNKSDCLTGHYNLKGIFLPQRYPGLSDLKHRKFSILREPFETAHSGIRYGIKQGWISSDLSKDEQMALLVKRANYFSRVLGVTSRSQITELFDRYWFIAPLDRIEHVMRVVEHETGRKGIRPETLNTTDPGSEPVPQSVQDAFYEKSELDYELYNLAQLRFGRFSARMLDPIKPA